MLPLHNPIPLIWPIIVDKQYPMLEEYFDTDKYLRMRKSISSWQGQKIREMWGEIYFILVDPFDPECNFSKILHRLPWIYVLVQDEDMQRTVPMLCPAYSESNPELFEEEGYEVGWDLESLLKII